MIRFSLCDTKFLVYLTGGGISSLADVGSMQLLILAKVAPLPAASVGFVASMFVNYLFHSRLTFKTGSGSNGDLPRYLSAVALNYLITLGLVAASLGLFGQALPGKLLSLPVIAVNGYLLGKHWIFK